MGMLSGFRGENANGYFLIVTAGSNTTAFEAHKADVEDLGGREPDAHEYFTDPRLRNLPYAYVFEADDEQEIDCVIASLDIEIVPRGQAKSRSEAMAGASVPDIFEDERPISEILGLDKHDPWNVLSEQDKLASLLSEESKEKRKGVTGESFKPRDNLAKVTDVDMTRLADGSIRIDRVVAVKRPDMLFTVDEMDGEVWCCFSPSDYWEAHKAIPDTHMLEDVTVLGVPEGTLDEMAENQFMSLGMSADELKTLFLGLGFVHEPALGAEKGEETSYMVYSNHSFERMVEVARLLGLKDYRASEDGRCIDTDNPLVVGNLLAALRRRGIDFMLLTSDMQRDAPEPEPGMDVLAGRPFKMFFRLDVTGVSLETAIETFVQAGVDLESSFLQWGETDDGVWFANTIERLAEKNRDVLAERLVIETEIYATNTFGERLVPKGVKVIDPNAVEEIGPRPWNGVAFSAEDLKSVKAREFIFAGRDTDNGVLLFFTPKSYFAEHEAPWDADLAPYIEGLLPGFLTRVEPNVYSTSVCDYEHILLVLSRAGFQESLLFRAWLNYNR